MTDFLSTLCMLGLFAVVIFFIISALSRGRQEAEANTQRERPRYDDDDIRSSGGFGRPAPPPNPTYDTPEINSSGGFGRPAQIPRTKDTSRSGGFGGALGKKRSSRADDDHIESSGSFGGR